MPAFQFSELGPPMASKDAPNQTTVSSPKNLRTLDFLGGPIPCVALMKTKVSLNIAATKASPPTQGEPQELDCLVYGQGPFLRQRPLRREVGKLATVLVFQDQHVHGIYVNSSESCPFLWVWGGRRLAAVFIGHNDATMSISDECRHELGRFHWHDDSTSTQRDGCSSISLPDWIWDVKAITTATGSQNESTFALAIGLAHNTIEILHGSLGCDEPMSIRVQWGARVLSSTPCLLYCLTIHPCTFQVAVGSVTQGILLWNFREAMQGRFRNTGKLVSPVTAQLTDHQGVLHDLSFSQCGTMLVSASDDRTVRLWQKQDERKWVLQWTAYGHTARCWKASFAQNDTMVVSTAEDGTARIWSVNSGESLRVLRSHASPNVWSHAHDDNWLVTGGGNGTVAFVPWVESTKSSHGWNVTLPDDRPCSAVNSGSRGEGKYTMAESRPRKKGKGKPALQVVVGTQFCTINNSDTLLVATRNGALHSLNMEKGDWKRYRDWCAPVVTRNTAVKASDGISCAKHPSRLLVAIGLKTGGVLLTSLEEDSAQGEDNFHLLPVIGRVCGANRLNWLSPSLLASFHAQILRVWRIPVVDVKSGTLVETFECGTYSTGLRAVVTCVSINQDSGGDLIAAGDNRGHVFTFKAVSSRLEKDQSIATPLCIRRLHSKENVNDVYWNSAMSLVSVGNDGMICLSTVSPGGQISPGASIPVSPLSGISRILPLPQMHPQKGYLVAGYISNTLSVVDPISGYEFLTLDTGGRGRGSTLHIDTGNRLNVAICKNRKDGLNDLLVQRHDILARFSRRNVCWSYGLPLHHESIFDACAVHLPDRRVLLVSGSEDCSSRIVVWFDGNFRASYMLTPQESGVRAVCASVFSEPSSTLIAVGGSKLAIQFFRVYHGTDASQDIRVDLVGSGKLINKATMDHRINDLACIQRTISGHQNIHLVASGDSNGRLHLFVINENLESSEHLAAGVLIHEAEYPILSLSFFAIQDVTWLAFGTSNGDVGVLEMFWRDSDSTLMTPFSQLRTMYSGHAVGTNSIDTLVVCEKPDEFSVYIVSGGDDQRLTLVQAGVSVAGDDGVALFWEEPVYMELANASAIRSVQWLDSSRVATVGYSGVLCVWTRHRHGLSLEDSIPVQVGDINGMAVAKLKQESRVLLGVAGCGLQLFEYKMAES